MEPDMSRPTLPWWRAPAGWMMVGGPLTVVIASFVTLFLAVHGADTPLDTHAVPAHHATAAATQARNHAVTPAH